MSSNNKYLLFVLVFSISIISLPSQFSFGDDGTVSVDSFDVDYNIDNGILDMIFLDPDFVELILTMDTTSDGTVEITIPRSLLDAKFDTLDDEFFILVDGFETDYAEINSNSEYRTLVIPGFGASATLPTVTIINTSRFYLRISE